MNRIFQKKWTVPAFVALMAVLLIVSCGMFIDGYNIAQIDENGKEVYYAYAGQNMEFSVNGHLECNTQDNNGVTGNLVFAMLVPKDWNFADNAVVTYKNDLADNPDELLAMELMPSTSLPKNGGGKTWQQCLQNRYGVGGFPDCPKMDHSQQPDPKVHHIHQSKSRQKELALQTGILR